MKITLFSGNQSRHLNLVKQLSLIAEEVHFISEVNTVFPIVGGDFFKKSDAMQEYFSCMINAENFLFGDIGVGKTTFVRFLINHLQAKHRIKKSDILSPTFNIVYDYTIGDIKILHYDLYRLKNYNDILELYMGR